MNKKIIGFIVCLVLTVAIIPVLGDPGISGIPSNPSPADGSTMVTIYAGISWDGGEQGGESGYTYDVYFGTVNPPPKILSNYSGQSYFTGHLNFETTYYWQIVEWSEGKLSVEGPIWKYTTATNQAPFQPQILSGPQAVGPSMAAKFYAISADPETDQLYYQWDWGDGNMSDWLGPYPFGVHADAAYQWANNGEYDIKVRAKDTLDKESSWSLVRHASIARQINIGILKPGFMYFDILGFTGGYAYIYALDQLAIACYISTGGFFINATVSSAVDHATFEVTNLFFTSEQVMVTDSDMSDNCDGSFTLRPGFYKATVYAYDQDGNLIDRHTRDYFLFLEIGSRAKSTSNGLGRLSRL